MSTTDEEARELAGRWADKCEACKSDRDAPDADAECTDWLGRSTEPLTDAERERLFAWVRERMLGEGDMSASADPKQHLAEAVGLAFDLDDPALSHAEYLDRCWALCKASGWPS